MAAPTAFLRIGRQRLILGLPPRRAFWEKDRKKEGKPDAADSSVPGKEETVLVCPPLRSRKYLPPEDIQSCLESHIKKVFGISVPKNWQEASLGDISLKYHLLAQLAADLGHAVPNNQLHEMKTAKDVLDFYSTPVKDASKFDELITQELPANLRISWHY
uniref:Large ribosomal subunit protein mL50 n=1 Tax=Salvator merianae TaxID=96440 RepID=A0A8D0E531_SALMN